MAVVGLEMMVRCLADNPVAGQDEMNPEDSNTDLVDPQIPGLFYGLQWQEDICSASIDRV